MLFLNFFKGGESLLTVDDIKNASFRRANFGGYKPEDVDAFIDDVQISFEQLIAEKEELLSRVKDLSAKVDKFYEEDNSIKSVILNAQKIAEKTLDDAKSKTSDMINSAAEKSEKMINEAKKKVSINAEISEKLKEESSKLRKKLEEIYEKHMKIIRDIPIDSKNAEKSSAEIKENPENFKDKVNINDFKVDFSKNSKPGSSEGDSVKDIFSSEKLERPRKKFENLKFGSNVTDDERDEKHAGAYFGIFKKK